MSEAELVPAFLAGVVMASPSTVGCCRSSSTPGSTDCAGMSDERRDDALERRRSDVYSSARIVAAAALILVLVVLLILDVVVPDYHVSPGTILPLGLGRSAPGGRSWLVRRRTAGSEIGLSGFRVSRLTPPSVVACSGRL